MIKQGEQSDNVIEPLSESNDLSYLSRLQGSMEMVPEVKEPQLSKVDRSADSQVNYLAVKETVASGAGNGPLKQSPEPVKQSLELFSPKGTQLIVAQHWSQDTESLLVFNPKDEAVRESQAFQPLTEEVLASRGAFREVLEHLQLENQYLREKVLEGQEMVQLQKQMLMDVIGGSVDQVHMVSLKNQQLELRLLN